ncbi:MAG: hypothetical protein ABFR82_09905, partial [Nitrospirota bacterium]
MKLRFILVNILLIISIILASGCSKQVLRGYSGPDMPENEVARLNVESAAIVISLDETDITYDSSKIDEIHIPPGEHKITISYVTPEPAKPYENLDPSAQAEGNNITRNINVAAAKNYYVNVTYFDKYNEWSFDIMPWSGHNLKKWPNGDKYVGNWKKGIRHGQGTMTWVNRDEYAGEWKKGKMTGVGTMTWANGDKYVGKWKNDQRKGQGIMTWANGNKYVGKWKNDQRKGQGIMTWANGNKYIGKWKFDKRNGMG